MDHPGRLAAVAARIVPSRHSGARHELLSRASGRGLGELLDDRRAERREVGG